MNTKMLMLGILLIAGLSFAQPPNWNWMEYTVNRYACNYAYSYYGYTGGDYDMGMMEIAEIYDNACSDPEYWDCEAMYVALEDMAYALDGDSGWEICEEAGCYGSEGMSVTLFRGSMLEYNVAAAGFRSYFLSGLRAYLADGGDRAAVLEDLQEARSDYILCIEDTFEEGGCWVCPY